MSRSLAPSKSTVYIGNLPFSLTNNDLHQILSPFGKVVRITVVKDRDSRRSKGVAFALFLEREQARDCAVKLNNTKIFGRTVKASIARDNGRAAEFIRRREYPNKSRCYECGEYGHLSYGCPRNALGGRDPPPKKKKIRKSRPKQSSRSAEIDPNANNDTDESDSTVERELEEAAMDSWSAAINYQASLTESGNTSTCAEPVKQRNPRIRLSAYFSDEEELEEDE